VNPDRPCDVFEVLLAEILEIEIAPLSDLIMDDPRHIHSARPGQRLYSCGDVDAVSKDVAFLGDDVAEIDPDSYGDALFIRQRLVRLCDRIAQRSGAARGLDAAVELGEHQLDGLLEDISA